jgi:hypothetical protein
MHQLIVKLNSLSGTFTSEAMRFADDVVVMGYKKEFVHDAIIITE